MTKEQRQQAEAWVRVLEGGALAALLRAGIAASEECERLRDIPRVKKEAKK